MAYKNSGAMKFNDATDLVIRADPDGTVESVYNRADGFEYIGSYAHPVNVEAKITNNTSSTSNLYLARVDSDNYIEAARPTIASAQTSTVNLLKYGVLRTDSGTVWAVVSGEAEILSSGNILINGNCELTINTP